MGHDNSVNWEQLEKDYVICHGDLLEGAVDMHLHVAPSLMYRKCDIAELTLRCEQFGYKAVVTQGSSHDDRSGLQNSK